MDNGQRRNETPNIILLVSDCLRSDFSDRLTVTDDIGHDKTLFKNAYSTSSWTAPVHASLFTGDLPSEHGTNIHTPDFSPSSPTLQERLSSEGYETAAFSANPWVSESFGFNRGFNTFEQINPPLIFEDAGNPRHHDWSERKNTPITKSINELKWILDGNPFQRIANRIYVHFFQQYPLPSADRVNKAIFEWLSPSREPFFLFANYMDVHEPYQSEEQDQSEALSDFGWYYKSIGESVSPETAELVREAYSSSVDKLDRSIIDLLRFLSENDLLNDTILILLSDHGQALGERNYWGHGVYLIEELINVPLMIFQHDRFFSSKTVTKPVSLADLPKYILNAANVSEKQNSGTLDPTYLCSSDRDIPIHSQTYGLPKEYQSEVPDTGVSLEGYEVVHYAGWRGEYDRAADSLHLSKSEEVPHVDKTEAKQVIENELRTDTQQLQAKGDRELDDKLKSRLEQLGYR